MIRVFLADDHSIVRAGIRQLLDTAPDVTVVGEAGDGRRTLNALKSTPCDVLVLDISLPIINGTEVLRRVRQSQPHVKVVVLSMYSEEQYAPRLLAAGAAAYLAKDCSEEKLIEVLRQVAGDGARAAGTTSARRANPPAQDGALPHERLTAREHQIFMLLFDGRTVSDIAAELNVGGSTISTHVANIKAKLGVRSVAEIVAYAHRHGLVS